MTARFALTPTHDTGAVTKIPSMMITVPPGRAIDDDELAAMLVDTGSNASFIADLLSAALAHERCGIHLYRSVAGRTQNPFLKTKYTSFGEETERHAEILGDLIVAIGGDPMYVSPMARATEATDGRLLESTFMLAGSVDVMTAEMVMLDAVLLAETIDRGNWLAIEAVAPDMADGALTERFTAAVREVLLEEDLHLEWAAQTRLRMVKLQASSRWATSAAATAEEWVDRIRTLFD